MRQRLTQQVKLVQRPEGVLIELCDDGIIPANGLVFDPHFFLKDGMIYPTLVLKRDNRKFEAEFEPITVDQYIDLKINVKELSTLAKQFSIHELDPDVVILVMEVQGHRFEYETSRAPLGGLFAFLFDHDDPRFASEGSEIPAA